MKIITAIILTTLTMACKTGSPAACIDQSRINKDAMCPMIYKPVCGCDGKTYANECMAANAGLITWTPGECANNN